MPTRLFLIVVGITLLALFATGQSVPDPTETIALTSAPPYSATGELLLLKADTNSVALHNPVLVVEGFDIDNSMNWLELYILLNQEDLVNDLLSFGRDLVVLNFTDSTADILANTALTESAIDYINAHRADPNDKFTSVGASLGGLTTRMALVEMPNPDVDTWISFDAPHEGANIPLGIQEYIEFFASYDAGATDLLTALDSPASRQLLLVHHSHLDGLAGGSIPERVNFQSMLDAEGYPTNCKTIAISNGSGFGKKYPFAPADHIIHWTGSSGISSYNADIYALPQSSATVFSGTIKAFGITIDSTTGNAYHPLSIDNAPGGGRGTFFQLFTNIPSDQISGDDYCNQTNHCFVPTVSALGIPIENLELNLAINASLTALSPFDEIHYAVHNEVHVEINTHNKRWIMRAVLEDYDTDKDGFDDYEECLMGTAYNSSNSTLQVVLSITPDSTNDTIRIAWDALPNTQYEVWFTDVLDDPWQLIETIPPATESPLTREYVPATESPAGFFRITAKPVDPVVD